MDLSIIKKLRKIKKLSQQDLGNKLGVSGAYIQQIENNKKNPSIKTLNNIANALEVELDILFNGVSLDIYTRNDVFNLYNKLNTRTKLSNFLGFTDDYDINFIGFKEGLSADIELYTKLANYLNLTDAQIYNWILSDCIISLVGYDDFKISNVSHDDIKYIIDNNVLNVQSINSLISEGLSKENKSLLREYFSSKSTIQLKSLDLNIETYQTLKSIVSKSNIDSEIDCLEYIPRELLEKDIELLNNISELEKKLRSCEDLTSRMDILLSMVNKYIGLSANYKNVISYLYGGVSGSTQSMKTLVEELSSMKKVLENMNNKINENN